MPPSVPSPELIQEAQNVATRHLSAQLEMRKQAFSLSRRPLSWDEYLWQREQYEKKLEKLEASRTSDDGAEKLGLGILFVISLFIFPMFIVAMGALAVFFIKRGQQAETDKKIEELERKLSAPAPSYLEPLSERPSLTPPSTTRTTHHAAPTPAPSVPATPSISSTPSPIHQVPSAPIAPKVPYTLYSPPPTLSPTPSVNPIPPAPPIPTSKYPTPQQAPNQTIKPAPQKARSSSTSFGNDPFPQSPSATRATIQLRADPSSLSTAQPLLTNNANTATPPSIPSTHPTSPSSARTDYLDENSIYGVLYPLPGTTPPNLPLSNGYGYNNTNEPLYPDTDLLQNPTPTPVTGQKSNPNSFSSSTPEQTYNTLLPFLPMGSITNLTYDKAKRSGDQPPKPPLPPQNKYNEYNKPQDAIPQTTHDLFSSTPVSLPSAIDVINPAYEPFTPRDTSTGNQIKYPPSSPIYQPVLQPNPIYDSSPEEGTIRNSHYQDATLPPTQPKLINSKDTGGYTQPKHLSSQSSKYASLNNSTKHSAGNNSSLYDTIIHSILTTQSLEVNNNSPYQSATLPGYEVPDDEPDTNPIYTKPTLSLEPRAPITPPEPIGFPPSHHEVEEKAKTEPSESVYETPTNSIKKINKAEQKVAGMLFKYIPSLDSFHSFDHLYNITDDYLKDHALPSGMDKKAIIDEVIILTDQYYHEQEMKAYYEANQTPKAKFAHGLSRAVDIGANILLLNRFHGKIPRTPRYDFSKSPRSKIHQARDVSTLALSSQATERLTAQRMVQEMTPVSNVHQLKAPPKAHPLSYTHDGKLDSGQDAGNNSVSLLFQKAYDQVRAESIPPDIKTLLENSDYSSPIKDIYQMAEKLHQEISKENSLPSKTLSLGNIYETLHKDGNGHLTENAIFDVMESAGVIYRDELIKAEKESKKKATPTSLLSQRSSKPSALPESFLRCNKSVKERFDARIPRKLKANLEQASSMLADTLASPDEKTAKGHVATELKNAERTGVLDRVVHSALEYGHVSSTKETQQQELSVTASLAMGGRLFYSFNHESERLQFMEHLYGGNFTDIGGRIYKLPTIKQIDGKDYIQKTLLNSDEESITVLEAVDKTSYYILGEKGTLYSLTVSSGFGLPSVVKNISINAFPEEGTPPYTLSHQKYGSITVSKTEYKDTNILHIGENNYKLEESLNNENERIFTLTDAKDPTKIYLLGSHGTLYELPADIDVSTILVKKGEYYLPNKDPKKEPSPITGKASFDIPDIEKQKILNPNNASTTTSEKALAKGFFAFRRPTSTHSVDQSSGVEVKSFWKGFRKVIGIKGVYEYDRNDIGMNIAIGGIGNTSKHADYYKDAIISARQQLLNNAKTLDLTEEDILKNKERLDILPDGVHGHMLVYSSGNYMLIGIEKSEYGKGEHDISGKSGEKSAFLIDGKINGCKDRAIVTWMQVPPGEFGDIRVNMDKERIKKLKADAQIHHGRPLSENGQLSSKEIQQKVQKPLGISITNIGKELQEDAKRKYQHFDIHATQASNKCLEAMAGAGLSPTQQKYYKKVMADITKEYQASSKVPGNIAAEIADQQFTYLSNVLMTESFSKKTPKKIDMKKLRPEFEAQIAWEKYSDVAAFLKEDISKVSRDDFIKNFKNKPQTNREEALKQYINMHRQIDTCLSHRERLDDAKRMLLPQKFEDINKATSKLIEETEKQMRLQFEQDATTKTPAKEKLSTSKFEQINETSSKLSEDTGHQIPVQLEQDAPTKTPAIDTPVYISLRDQLKTPIPTYELVKPSPEPELQQPIDTKRLTIKEVSETLPSSRLATPVQRSTTFVDQEKIRRENLGSSPIRPYSSSSMR